LGEESAGFAFVLSWFGANWFDGNWFDGDWLDGTLAARFSFARASAAGLVWFGFITIAAGSEIGFVIPTTDSKLETVTEEASVSGLPGPEPLPDRALLADAGWSAPVTIAAPLGVMGTGWRLASPACTLLSGAGGLTAAASSGIAVCEGVAGTG